MITKTIIDSSIRKQSSIDNAWWTLVLSLSLTKQTTLHASLFENQDNRIYRSYIIYIV